MNNEEIFQKLTQLFASKINYDGEFNSLFFIETLQGNLKINFLNKQHYHYILLNLKSEILKIVGSDVHFGYLNMQTSSISMKTNEENKKIIKPAPVKPKDRVELPTIKNRTLKQIEEFMFDRYDELSEKQKEIRKIDEDYLENKLYYSNYGQMLFMAELYQFFKKIKDYDEE